MAPETGYGTLRSREPRCALNLARFVYPGLPHAFVYPLVSEGSMLQILPGRCGDMKATTIAGASGLAWHLSGKYDAAGAGRGRDRPSRSDLLVPSAKTTGDFRTQAKPGVLFRPAGKL